MQVSDIVEKKGDRIVSTSPGTEVSQIARTMEQERVGATLVRAADGQVLGIISERDIVHGIAQRGSEALEMRASELMTSSVITCDLETDVEELMAKMLSARIRHLPVVRGDELLAIISIGDVVNSVVSELKWMRSALQDQVMKSAAWSVEEDLE